MPVRHEESIWTRWGTISQNMGWEEHGQMMRLCRPWWFTKGAGFAQMAMWNDAVSEQQSDLKGTVSEKYYSAARPWKDSGRDRK